MIPLRDLNARRYLDLVLSVTLILALSLAPTVAAGQIDRSSPVSSPAGPRPSRLSRSVVVYVCVTALIAAGVSIVSQVPSGMLPSPQMLRNKLDGLPGKPVRSLGGPFAFREALARAFPNLDEMFEGKDNPGFYDEIFDHFTSVNLETNGALTSEAVDLSVPDAEGVMGDRIRFKKHFGARTTETKAQIKQLISRMLAERQKAFLLDSKYQDFNPSLREFILANAWGVIGKTGAQGSKAIDYSLGRLPQIEEPPP